MAKQATAQRSRFHIPKALPKQTRLIIESAIERHHAAVTALIAFLDAADGDCDLEDGGDSEPSLGDDLRGYDFEADHTVPFLLNQAEVAQ